MTFYIDDQQGRTQFYKSLLSTVGITGGLKLAIHKKRPSENKQNRSGGGGNSFPSGHTSAAFQGASFTHYRYGLKYAAPAYLGAAFVGYSRVDSDSHYVEDVLAGAAIGIASSWYFTSRFQEKEGIVVAPSFSREQFGLAITKTFRRR